MSRDIILLCVVILFCVICAEQVNFLSQEYIDGINKVALKWKVSNKYYVPILINNITYKRINFEIDLYP